MRKEGNCLYCGKHVVQVFRGKDRFPGRIFCCREHAMMLRDRKNYQRVQTQLVNAAKQLYEKLQRAPTVTELRSYTGKSKSVLASHGYDTKRLKQMFGQEFLPRRRYKKCSFQQAVNICQEYLLQHKSQYISNLALRDTLNISMDYIDKMDLIQFRKQHGLPTDYVRDMRKLKQSILAYIKQQGQYTPLRDILDVFHINYHSTFQRMGWSIQEFNQQVGFSKSSISYGQTYMYRRLRQQFPWVQIDTQRKFIDLISPKGYPLRYDLYLPLYKIAIQIDGPQHRDPNNKYYSQYLIQRDLIKTKYAASRGIYLLRIPFDNTKQFQRDAQKAIHKLLDVVKPVELLGNLNDQGVTQVNQQPSRERRYETEGSETIERETVQLQLF